MAMIKTGANGPLEMTLRSLLTKSEESVAFLVGVFCIATYLLLQYSRGRSEWLTSLLFNPFIWIGSILVAAFLLFLPIALGIIIIFRSLPALFQRAFQRFLWCCSLGILALAMGVATVGVARSRSAFALGYAARVRSQMNIVTFQRWAIRTIKAAPTDHITAVEGSLPDTGSLVFSQVSVSPNAEASQSYVELRAVAPTLQWYGLMVGAPAFRCPPETYEIVPGMCVAPDLGTLG
jgi:hypothetical protein